MKNKKLILWSVAVFAVLIATVTLIIALTKPVTQSGEKNISVTIVFSEENEKKYEINTNAEYLADALYQKELITEEEYKAGFYTVIDGVKADYNVDKSWWCVTKNGEMTSVGMNELPIADGENFEITYTIN